MNERSDFSSDADFRQGAEIVLEALWEQADELDMDEVEPQRTPGSLILQFEDGSVFMLSLQTPVHEIWLSANYTAWHFLSVGGKWIERDTSQLLDAALTDLLSEKIGQELRFSI